MVGRKGQYSCALAAIPAGTTGCGRPIPILANMAFLFRNKRVPEGVDPARIPPGQTLTAPDRWPLLHFGPIPKTDIATWNFKVFGAVENELTLDYGELRALPSKEVVADIHCVTGWSRLGDKWTGVPIKDILARVKPKPEAKYVMAHSEYGYTTTVPLEVLDGEDNLLCYAWNGQDLTPDHGWPLRLFVPSKYFWKSAKWLRGLEFMERNRLGFWEQRGYHDEADPWKETRYW
jgi:DMSO/TMAO reductase YedYZ molybdopterin-dependent catalytic subunit